MNRTRLQCGVAIAAVCLMAMEPLRQPDPDRCGAAADSLARAWGQRGPWRNLSPYPVPRRAAPTDRIGVWLEEWRPESGGLELKRVTAATTDIARFGEQTCEYTLSARERTFGDADAGSWTDDSLRALVTGGREGLIYVWSPRMPLSKLGIREAQRAAARLGVPLTVVVAEDFGVRPLASLDIVYRNGTVHYPTLLFYGRGMMLGDALPGYKPSDLYFQYAQARFARAREVSPSTVPAKLWLDRGAAVETLRVTPTPRPVGFYFKPVGATTLVSYTSAEEAFLFDLASGQERQIPGTVDPVATPDGRLLTRPGLIWYDVGRLRAGDTLPLAIDRSLPDEYQSISALGSAGSTRRYRVATGWKMNVRYRDYVATLGADSVVQRIDTVGVPAIPCPQRSFSLPISAKTGHDFSVLDVATQTSKIVSIDSSGVCTDRMDLGFAAGKFAFGYDGTRVAFSTSRIDVDATGVIPRRTELVYRDAFVLTPRTGRLVPLTHNRSLRALSFSEFLPDGSIVLLDQLTRLRPDEAFRVLRVK